MMQLHITLITSLAEEIAAQGWLFKACQAFPFRAALTGNVGWRIGSFF
jgi:hypothetical protein